jgi:hypothetical protein
MAHLHAAKHTYSMLHVVEHMQCCKSCFLYRLDEHRLHHVAVRTVVLLRGNAAHCTLTCSLTQLEGMTLEIRVDQNLNSKSETACLFQVPL